MKLFKRTDIIIILIVLLAAALIAIPKFFTSDKLTAEIYVDGKLTESIDLNEVEKSYTVSENGIKSGKLTSGGETTACLPARVVISVKSNKNKTDIMTY